MNIVFIMSAWSFICALIGAIYWIIGSFLFFLSANYGQMDALVDDGSKAFRKTRLRAILAPAILLLLYVLFFIGAKDMEIRICVGMVSAFLIPCAYYNFKHIIIYDVDMGIIRQVKSYDNPHLLL